MASIPFTFSKRTQVKASSLTYLVWSFTLVRTYAVGTMAIIQLAQHEPNPTSTDVSIFLFGNTAAIMYCGAGPVWTMLALFAVLIGCIPTAVQVALTISKPFASFVYNHPGQCVVSTEASCINCDPIFGCPTPPAPPPGCIEGMYDPTPNLTLQFTTLTTLRWCTMGLCILYCFMWIKPILYDAFNSRSLWMSGGARSPTWVIVQIGALNAGFVVGSGFIIAKGVYYGVRQSLNAFDCSALTSCNTTLDFSMCSPIIILSPKSWNGFFTIWAKQLQLMYVPSLFG
jgi:hypothetical protein